MTNQLTIITINYNNAFGLEKTIMSIFKQTFKNLQYIVIDGGSNDTSKLIIEKYLDIIDYWVSEPDSGVYHAMNKGLKVATGDYVLFLNSGDFLYNETVLEQVINIIKAEDELVYGDVILKNDELQTERLQVHPERPQFSYFYKQTICQQACFIKRSLFERIFYFNERYKISSDWEFLIYAIYIENVIFRKIDMIISVYDMGGISSSAEYRPIARNEREETMHRYFPLFIEDYKKLMSHSSKRFTQLEQIEGSKFLRTITSVFFRVLMFFVSDKNK